MSRPPGTWRYNLVFALLLLAVAALAARLALMLREDAPRAADAAERQQRVTVPLPGRIGTIHARTLGSYEGLAISRQVPGCYADPALLDEEEVADVAIKTAEALGLNAMEVQDLLRARRKIRFALRRERYSDAERRVLAGAELPDGGLTTGQMQSLASRLAVFLRRAPSEVRRRFFRPYRCRFVWLKRRVSESQAGAIRRLKLPAVRIMHEWVREYPNGPLAAHVVGFRTADGRGGGGVELSLQRHLQAEDGRRVMLADAARRPIWPLPNLCRAPHDGSGVFLCIDAHIQSFLEQAVEESVERFGAQWGTGVVADPHTGDVLAMCSVPTFDPGALRRADPDALVNRAVTFAFEPGSVLKPIYAAAAVQAGVVGYDTQVFCEHGVYRAPRGGRITDHGKRYGDLSVAEVVTYSSNIGMAKVGELLGIARLHEAARAFGLGQKTGIELPAESPGKVRALAAWNGYSLRRVPFGQEISTTAIQLTMAFSALVNGGVLMRPRLVDHVTSAEGEMVLATCPQPVRRVLSPAVSAQTRAVLRQVVEQGTGRRCRLSRWQALGKTGTAQIADRTGYIDGAYVGSFAGAAPADDPAVVCLIVVYWPDPARGYYGSIVAAPYVARVLEQALDYLEPLTE
jgi:cell division protein FtsI/penicillin-binding protein 2